MSELIIKYLPFKIWNYNTKVNNQPVQLHELDVHLRGIVGLKADEKEQILISASLDGLLIAWYIDMSQIVYKVNIGEKILDLGLFKNTKTYYLKLRNEIRIFEMHLHALPFAVLESEVFYTKKLNGFMSIPNRVVCCQKNGSYKYLSPIYGGCLAEESLKGFHENVSICLL